MYFESPLNAIHRTYSAKHRTRILFCLHTHIVFLASIFFFECFSYCSSFYVTQCSGLAENRRKSHGKYFGRCGGKNATHINDRVEKLHTWMSHKHGMEEKHGWGHIKTVKKVFVRLEFAIAILSISLALVFGTLSVLSFCFFWSHSQMLNDCIALMQTTIYV